MSANLSVVETECCICMEALNCNTNYVKTECGHEFHCSCLMKNTAHNGYGCPFCRAVLAEEVLDDDSQYEDDIDEIAAINDNEDEDDDVYLGMRMFINRAEGNAIDEDDVNELNKIENEKKSEITNEEEKKNNNLYVEYLEKREKHLHDSLKKHNIGINEMLSLLLSNQDMAFDENDSDGVLSDYLADRDLNEYNWDTIEKVRGLIKSISSKYIHSHPPPFITIDVEEE